MLNRLIRGASEFTRQKDNQSAALVVFARDTVRGFITTAHHTLMVLGIAAIAALALMFVKPEVTDYLKELSPFAEAEVEAQAEADDEDTPPLAALMEAQGENSSKEAAAGKTDAAAKAETTANTPQQKWVTTWLAKRYRVAADATDMLVSAAYLTASEIKLDPLLILSVMAIESGFNPFAESPMGAQGLMQVMSKVHRDKFEELGGVKAALNPIANIKVGSLILKDYVTRGGSVEAGLKLYVGAGAFETDSGYGSRVLAEYRRLKEVAMGKKVPVYATAANTGTTKRQAEKKADDGEAVSAAPAQTQPLAQADHPASL